MDPEIVSVTQVGGESVEERLLSRGRLYAARAEDARRRAAERERRVREEERRRWREQRAAHAARNEVLAERQRQRQPRESAEREGGGQHPFSPRLCAGSCRLAQRRLLREGCANVPVAERLARVAAPPRASTPPPPPPCHADPAAAAARLAALYADAGERRARAAERERRRAEEQSAGAFAPAVDATSAIIAARLPPSRRARLAAPRPPPAAAPAPSPRPTGPPPERFLARAEAWERGRAARLRAARAETAAGEHSECTFHPRINRAAAPPAEPSSALAELECLEELILAEIAAVDSLDV